MDVEDETIKQLQQELELLKQRNARVEADKAWEVSGFRIASICVITYIVASALLFALGAKRFWLDAVIPPVGFLLSAQSLPAIKRWWTDTRYQRAKN